MSNDQWEHYRLLVLEKVKEIDALDNRVNDLEKELAVFKTKVTTLAGAISFATSLLLPLLLDWIKQK